MVTGWSSRTVLLPLKRDLKLVQEKREESALRKKCGKSQDCGQVCPRTAIPFTVFVTGWAI